MKPKSKSKYVPMSVRGRKGGGNRKAIEAPDSLFSIANARIIDFVSEGEIEGFAHGPEGMLRDVYYDETPVQNPDGSRNFQFLTVEARYGTQDQSHIPGFPAVESELSVGLELKYGVPYTRSITNRSLSAVRVRLGAGPLSKTNDENGDVSGTSVAYAIDLSTDGGPFTRILSSAFSGKASALYERGHRIDLPKSEASGWVVRVRRLTPDSTTQYLQNKTFVMGLTEIIDGKFRYPMSALVATEIDASQFQTVPSRSFHLKGRIIRVPMNYDPINRTYATTGPGTSGGAWDGTFKAAYSNNPAWVFYDLVTHTRYGLGELLDENRVDKWSLYAIAQYCDEIVPDGFGGAEPRMTCNLYLQQAADAWKVLGDLTSVFRAICYWAGGTVVPVADRPSDPVYTYTNANVEGGHFVYASSSRQDRHSAVMVSYNDMTDMGRLKTDYYDDAETMARFGFRSVNINAIGCTSRGQARRLARWLLLSEKLLTNTVSFTVGMDGTFALPGQIVRIADQHRAGRRIGGRIAAVGVNYVAVDAMPSLAPSAGDVLTVLMPDGVTESRTISSVSADRIYITGEFSGTPVVEGAWSVEMTDLNTQLFRVLGVTKADNGTYAIQCLQHNPTIFGAVDFDEPITVPPTTVLPNSNQSPPTGVVITSVERAGQVIAMPLLSASWDPTPGAVRYRVQWQKESGPWSPAADVHGTSADFDTPFPGQYRVKVEAVNAIGIISLPTFSAPYTLGDQTLLPDVIIEQGEAIQSTKEIVEEMVSDFADMDARVDQVRDDAQAAADALNVRADVLRDDVDQTIADLDAESQARAAAIQGEAQARTAALLNEKLEREAAISAEQTIRQTEDESLAVAISQVAAGSGTQFDSKRIWYFDSDLESWSGTAGLAVVDGWLRPGNGTSSPYVQSPDLLGIDGQAYRFVKMRIKKVGNPTWRGWLRWTTSTDNTFNGTKQATIPEPAFDANGLATIDWSDIGWWPNTVRRIRVLLSVTQTETDYFLIDWVAVGRPTPGAGVALVQEETAARVTALAAEAAQRNTLAVQMRGDYTGTDVAELTQGLIHSERQARVTADSVFTTNFTLLGGRTANGQGWVLDEAKVHLTPTQTLSQKFSSIDATFNDPETGLAKAHSRITAESLVRSTADTAFAQNFTLLGAKTANGQAWNLALDKVMVGPTETLNQRLTSITANFGTQSGRIDTEIQARADADSALSGRIDTVQATANNAATKAELTSAQNTLAAADQALSERVDITQAGIRADQLVINPDFEMEGYGWQASFSSNDPTSPLPANVDAFRNLTGLVHSGEWALRVSPPATSVDTNTFNSRLFPVAPGEEVHGSIRFRTHYSSPLPVGTRLLLGVRWFDSANSLMPEIGIIGQLLVAAPHNRFYGNDPLAGEVVAPSGAAYGRFYIHVSKEFQAASGPVYFDTMEVGRGGRKALARVLDSTIAEVQDQGDTLSAHAGTLSAHSVQIGNAASAASNAQNAAQSASDLAGGKGKVFFQESAPPVAEQQSQNLWIDTTGGNNTPKRWNGSAWMAVTDKVATDAAAAAAAAQGTATAAASAIAATNITVSEQGGTLSAHGSQLASLSATVGDQESSITELREVSAIAGVGNLVYEPSFEVPSAWDFSMSPNGTTALSESVSRTGTRYLRMNANPGGQQSVESTRTFPVTEGVPIRMGFSYRRVGSGAVPNGYIRLAIRWFAADGSQISVVATPASTTADFAGGWSPMVTGQMLPPAGARSARILVQSSHTTGAAWAVDDVFVQPLSQTMEEVLAKYTLAVNAGGDVAGMQLIAGGGTSAVRFLADLFALVNSGGDGLTLENGTLWVRRGGWSMISGPTLGEGMLFYIGPTPASASAATKASALFYVDQLGTGYFAGQVLQGVLRNFNSNTTLSTTAEVSTGSVSSNNKTVAVSARFQYQRVQSYPDFTSQITLGAGATQAVVVLERRYGTGSWTTLGTLTLPGVDTLANEVDAPSIIAQTISGQIFATDTASLLSREYRTRVVSRTIRSHTVTGQSSSTPPPTQSQYQSIESME